jgi:hypothetical protein
MRNGVTASLDTAFAAAVDLAPRMSLLGSSGTLEMLPEGDIILHRPDRPPERIRVERADNPVARALERWFTRVCSAINDQKPLVPDFSTGLQCARVLEKMHREAR